MTMTGRRCRDRRPRNIAFGSSCTWYGASSRTRQLSLFEGSLKYRPFVVSILDIYVQ